MFFVGAAERLSVITTDGARLVEACVARESVDDDEISRDPVGGGVDDVLPSRSLLIELDVCAAYDGR